MHRIYAAKDTFANVFICNMMPVKGDGGPWLAANDHDYKITGDPLWIGFTGQLCRKLEQDQIAEVLEFRFKDGIVTEVKYGPIRHCSEIHFHPDIVRHEQEREEKVRRSEEEFAT